MPELRLFQIHDVRTAYVVPCFCLQLKTNFRGCDGCEEWYHGDCINISEKEAKHIKHYYCQRCKEEDPSLQTVFRAVPVATPTNSKVIDVSFHC